MTSINGNFGLFGNNDDKRVNQQNGLQKPAEIKPDVPVGKTQNVEHKELGDELLESANFYAGMGLNLGAIKKPTAGSLEDLAQVARTLDTSKADRADKKAVYNAIEGKDWSTWLMKAYAYDKLNKDSMKNIASVDFSEENMPEYIADDLNAEVVIA
ncbi:unknown [Clostridium sp. CAG:715]|nr:unknown [Clostridium sp. CAG:715]